MPTYTIDEYNALLQRRRNNELDEIPPDRSHIKIAFVFIGLFAFILGMPLLAALLLYMGYPAWQAFGVTFGIIAIFGALMHWADKSAASLYTLDDGIPWDSDEPWDGGMGEYIETVEGELVDDTARAPLAPRNGLLRLMSPKKRVSKHFNELDFEHGAMWTPDFVELLDCPRCERVRWHGTREVSKGNFQYTCRKCGNVQ